VGVLYAIINLTLFLAVIVVPMAALWYGSAGLGWGFNNHPWVTTGILVVFVACVIFGAFALKRVCPHCTIHIGAAQFHT
jgi:hypothetical protein